MNINEGHHPPPQPPALSSLWRRPCRPSAASGPCLNAAGEQGAVHGLQSDEKRRGCRKLHAGIGHCQWKVHRLLPLHAAVCRTLLPPPLLPNSPSLRSRPADCMSLSLVVVGPRVSRPTAPWRSCRSAPRHLASSNRVRHWASRMGELARGWRRPWGSATTHSRSASS